MIAVRSLSTELHSYGVCFLINLSHETDLMALFVVGGLVDANNVRPKKRLPSLRNLKRASWRDLVIVMTLPSQMILTV